MHLNLLFCKFSETIPPPQKKTIYIERERERESKSTGFLKYASVYVVIDSHNDPGKEFYETHETSQHQEIHLSWM